MKLDGRVRGVRVVRVVRVVKGRGDVVGQGLIEALTVPIKAQVPCEVKGKKGKGKGKENEKKRKG